MASSLYSFFSPILRFLVLNKNPSIPFTTKAPLGKRKLFKKPANLMLLLAGSRKPWVCLEK